MNYLPMNEELRKDLLKRGFVNTNGCYFQKVAGMFTLRVWVHNRGGQAEVNSRVSRDSYSRVARLPEFDTTSEVDTFFAKYDVSIPWGRLTASNELKVSDEDTADWEGGIS